MKPAEFSFDWPASGVLRKGPEFPINSKGEFLCPNDDTVLVWNAGSGICPVCEYLLDADAVESS